MKKYKYNGLIVEDGGFTYGNQRVFYIDGGGFIYIPLNKLNLLMEL